MRNCHMATNEDMLSILQSLLIAQSELKTNADAKFGSLLESVKNVADQVTRMEAEPQKISATKVDSLIEAARVIEEKVSELNTLVLSMNETVGVLASNVQQLSDKFDDFHFNLW